MSDTMKKRVFAIVAILVALGALGWISMGNMGEQLVYYVSPTELKAMEAKDSTVRLGGMVQPGTFKWDRDTQVIEFDLADGKNTVHVRNVGHPPQMFREGIGAVVEGRLDAEGVFQSSKVMVKHDENYQSPEGGALADMEQMKSSLEGR